MVFDFCKGFKRLIRTWWTAVTAQAYSSRSYSKAASQAHTPSTEDTASSKEPLLKTNNSITYREGGERSNRREQAI